MAVSFAKTFLMTGTGGSSNPAGAHLMICLLSKEGDIMIVPVVTRHPYSDASCVLQAVEHEFLTHESCIDYSFARKCSKAALDEQIALGNYTMKETVSPMVMKRVLEGLIASDETAPWVLEFCDGIEAAIAKIEEDYGE